MTPQIGLDDAQAMGYRVAILPALLFTSVIAACDRMLEQVQLTRRHPLPIANITVQETFACLGPSEWDNIRERFSKPGLAPPGRDPAV